ncbi:MAG: phosphotransferase enzyme family protein [Cyanobacteriota bacterium]
MDRLDRPRLAEHAGRFAIAGQVTAVEPLGSGNVNDTYRVDTSSGSTYVLQRINTRVFRRPELVMANLAALAAHVEQRRRSGRWPGCQAGRPAGRPAWEVPRPIPLAAGSGHMFSSAGEAWRLLSFVEAAESFDTVQGNDHAHQVGRALGTFHQLIHDLPAERLADTLEGFHVTPTYLADYKRLREASAVERCPESLWCQAFVAERESLAPVLEQARQAGRLPLRPIHGDPKVNNVMLCASTGQAVALVDLDTVKPGLIHYDIGDCLRSGCNPLGEDTGDPEAVRFDLALCRAMLGGYLSEGRSFLSAHDIAHLYDAIRLLPFELGLRFFSDHLAGNVYFKARHGRHNLDRARVQFRLVESIEAQEAPIRALIEQLCR